jgi:hypothetical protein
MTKWLCPNNTAESIMIAMRIVILMFLAQSVLGQVYCSRIIGHTPYYERILLPKGSPLRPSTFRGVDDLGPEAQYPETNRIDRIFSDLSRERTNGFFKSCLSEIPINTLELRCPGRLLSSEQVSELLRDTMVVPRSAWTNHMEHSMGGRYVFSLIGSKGGNYVIDERAGACALVIFPDDTYCCVMDPNYSCLKKFQQNGSTNGNHPKLNPK